MLPSKSRATQVFGPVPVHGANRDFFLSTAAESTKQAMQSAKRAARTAAHNSLS